MFSHLSHDGFQSHGASQIQTQETLIRSFLFALRFTPFASPSLYQIQHSEMVKSL